MPPGAVTSREPALSLPQPDRMLTSLLSALVLLAVLALACSSSGNGAGQSQAPDATPAVVEPTATPALTPTPQPVRLDILASRLVIPSLNIDSAVQRSQTIPYVDMPPPGCPGDPDASETITVPNQGITTPADNLEGLENKAWILGHSRWLGVAGIFFSLQDISLGDELFIEGTDRLTGAAVERQRFVVDGIYLTDTDSGETLINAAEPADIPAKPVVILQTSVREDGAGKQWILNEQKIRAKATNLVEGELNDPCKYLLLFVFAKPA